MWIIKLTRNRGGVLALMFPHLENSPAFLTIDSVTFFQCKNQHLHYSGRQIFRWVLNQCWFSLSCSWKGFLNINHDERFQFGFNVRYQRRSKHLNIDSTESGSFYECTPTKANQGPVFWLILFNRPRQRSFFFLSWIQCDFVIWGSSSTSRCSLAPKHRKKHRLSRSGCVAVLSLLPPFFPFKPLLVNQPRDVACHLK